MFQQYMVIDDKLVPEDVAPLILSEKLDGVTGPSVDALVHFVNDAEWEIPSAVTDTERKAGIAEGNSTRIMIEKMASVNKLKKTVFQVRIYPGSPAVRVITCVKTEPLFRS